MGLDTVELVLALEEEFGIEIDDAAAAEMITPRHVIDFISARRRSSFSCPTRGTFYHFRRICVTCYGCAREAVHPQAKLTTLLPDGMSRRVWGDLGERLATSGRVWPELHYPQHIRILRELLFLSLIGAVPLFVASLTQVWEIVPVAIILTVFLVIWLRRVTEKKMMHLRTEIPDHLPTVAHLIKVVAPAGWTEAGSDGGEIDRARVARRVRGDCDRAGGDR